jgi:peroxiredoxin
MLKLKILSLFMLIFTASCFSQNPGLKNGDILPNPEISWVDYKIIPENTTINLYDYKQDSYLLIAVMPDITESNTAAKIILTGLNTYFSEGLSFKSFDKYRYSKPDIKVLVVTANSKDDARKYSSKYNLSYEVIGDNKLDISNSLGVNRWNSGSDASFIYIADKNNKIIYARDDYRGEGEKLKDIQAKLFTCFDLKPDISNENYYSPLVQGDVARDFSFSVTGLSENGLEEYKLSDYLGKKNVLLAFYPAPFSYSCAYEVKTFDTYAEEQLMKRVKESGSNDLELLMVSVSNSYILSNWKKDMGLDNVKLVNDYNGSISMKYNSYNSFGYSNRTVFLINKEGKVEYINWNYDVNNDDDFGTIKEVLTASK